MMTPTTWITRSATALVMLAVVGVAAPAAAQGVESSPIDIDDLVPGVYRPSLDHRPGWLGVVLGEPAAKRQQTKSTAGPAKSGPPAGVGVARVLRGSPASSAGIEAGDRLLRIADTKVGSPGDVQQVVAAARPGRAVKVELRRDQSRRSLDITLAAKPGPAAVMQTQFIGHAAPAFSAHPVVDTSAKAVSLKTYAGKPLVIDFWATWCGPCRPVSRKLAQISQKVGNRARFVGLTSEPTAAVKRFLSTHTHGFDVATTAESVMSAYLVDSYPTVFVIDAAGKVAGVFIGVGHADEIERLIDSLAPHAGAD